MGGLIYGLLNEKMDNQKALEFSVAACYLKHTISGDVNLVTEKEVENLYSSDSGVGKVNR